MTKLPIAIPSDLEKLCTDRGISTNASDLQHAIASIKRRGKRLDKDIQAAAIGAIAHHALHGQVGPINDLVAALPASARKNALRQYIEEFAAVMYCTQSKAFQHSKTREADIPGALKTSWLAFKPDPDYKPVKDPFARFDALITAFEKDRKKLGEHSKVTAEMISAVKEAKRFAQVH